MSSLKLGWIEVIGFGICLGPSNNGFNFGVGVGVGFNPEGKLVFGTGFRIGLIVGPGIYIKGLGRIGFGMVLGPAYGYGGKFGYQLTKSNSNE